MCPNREILSIYFDKELDSPWKEKVQKHLEGCAPCRAQLEKYRRIRQELTGPENKGAMERVWDKLSFAAGGRERKSRGGRFWSGSVSIPIPAAAAAGLALILALGALAAQRTVKADEPPLAGLEVQDMVPATDMASLLQYLESENSPEMVIIRLPDTTFKNAGETTMLRAADYRGSSR
ncbi:MAG: zf-HC2 domain-containing protein [Spirochaetaceae bacterium]|nr:zf-HC2 domain-containing protein [Spirochaetaceae bacterium]